MLTFSHKLNILICLPQSIYFLKTWWFSKVSIKRFQMQLRLVQQRLIQISSAGRHINTMKQNRRTILPESFDLIWQWQALEWNFFYERYKKCLQIMSAMTIWNTYVKKNNFPTFAFFLGHIRRILHLIQRIMLSKLGPDSGWTLKDPGAAGPCHTLYQHA